MEMQEQKGTMSGELEQQGGVEQEQETAQPTKPFLSVRVVRDGMEAELMLQRSSSDTLNPEYDDIMAELQQQNVVYGINEGLLRELCREPQYNQVNVIARGTPPQTGNDGWITYRVRTVREMRPRIRDDGTADFKDIGFIEHVAAGQVLCHIHMPEKGADGCDVYGNPIEGLYGRTPSSPVGTNTVLNEDGTELRAACYGNVEVRAGIVHVLEVLNVAGDVDNSTGNIFFSGDVIISGDVKAGFNVQSGGSIVVKGNVEGANLEAADDISIAESMSGGGKGMLAAGGSIKCKYIQSSTVRCGGDLYADALMYCNTQVAGNLELSGKRAALIGGRSTISGKLVARNLGTTTHVATEICMSPIGPGVSQEAQELAQHIKELEGELGKLVQILTRYEEISRKTKLTDQQQLAIQAVRESHIQYNNQRSKSQAKLEKVLREQLEASQRNCYIECRDRVNTGVRISFGPVIMPVNESFVRSRIYVVKDKIVVSPL